MNLKHVSLVIALALIAPQVAAGQPGRERMHDRARTFLVLRIAEALNLPDEKALQVSRIIREVDEKRQHLKTQRREVERSLRSELDRPEPDPAKLGQWIAEANEIDEKIARIPEGSFREVQKILTVEQQARLILLRPEIQGQIRRAVRRRLEEGPGPQRRFRPLGD